MHLYRAIVLYLEVRHQKHPVCMSAFPPMKDHVACGSESGVRYWCRSDALTKLGN